MLVNFINHTLIVGIYQFIDMCRVDFADLYIVQNLQQLRIHLLTPNLYSNDTTLFVPYKGQYCEHNEKSRIRRYNHFQNAQGYVKL